MNKGKKGFVFVFLLLLLTALFGADLLFGSARILVSDLLNAILGNGDKMNAEILFSIRLPKAITAILAGIALSLCGILMQTLFRNPLAGPYVLGVNSGASLGVALVMLGGPALGMQGMFFQSGIVLASVTGALLTLLLVIAISARIRNNMGLLLAGIMLGQIVSALQSLLEYFSDPDSLKGFVLWNMASIGNVGKSDLTVFAPLVLLFSIAAILLIKHLDVMLLGENYAQSMGMNAKQKRILVILITGVLSGITTAYCGPIAFIGIAVPHICRILFKTSLHRIIIPAALIIGPSIMLVCDIICQLPAQGIILPLNVITSVVGAPVVLYLLFRNYRFVH